jgi:hypothetical protein
VRGEKYWRQEKSPQLEGSFSSGPSTPSRRILVNLNTSKNGSRDTFEPPLGQTQLGAGLTAVTRDTEGVPIVVVRHEGDLLTVYAGVDGLKVEKGTRVSRGQEIATIRAADPAVLHF